MPAPPKVRDRAGGVRVDEVLFQADANHFPQAPCHIGVSRKIEIDLKGEGDEPRPVAKESVLGGAVLERLPHLPRGVCQQQLFG